MLGLMPESVQEDTGFISLREKVLEYAGIYLMTKKRQKGCDGMGELAMVKEEFRDSLYELTDYCKRKGYLSGDIQYEIDFEANELAGLIMQR